MKITTSGVEVSSRVLGLMVLAFSLGFFYLYLHFVYPMEELRILAPAKAEDAAKRPANTPENSKAPQSPAGKTTETKK